MYAPTGAALVRCEMALWRSGTAGQTAHWTRRVRLARCLSTAAGVELSWSHLHHRESNSESTQGAEPVFVMHGLLGNKMNWRSLFRSGPLGELNRDVLVADARNHGASPHHSQMSYCAMVDDVLRLLDEQEIDRVIAVGHSMGGKTAMQLALRAPDRVERLVVCDIAPVVYSSAAGPSDRSNSTFLDVFGAMHALDLTRIQSRGEADKALSSAIPADGLRAFVLTNLKLDKQTKQFVWRCNLEILRRSVTDIMGFPLSSDTIPYSGPTLFLGGANSSYIAADHTESIQRLFPNASVEHIADAGHFVHVDQPGLVGQRIASFIGPQQRAVEN